VHGILNLANNVSERNRLENKIRVQPQLPRSLSVNFLYQKRQGDLRRQHADAAITCANRLLVHNAAAATHLHRLLLSPSRASFTTEDIEDIYMPRRLDLFERKVKAVQDQGDNSEQEEMKLKEERLHANGVRLVKSRSNSKRVRPDNTDRSRYTINIEQPQQQPTSSPAPPQSANQSFLSQAKIKLDQVAAMSGASHVSTTAAVHSGYFSNLNNKMKSSVNNLIRVSQNLAKSSEARDGQKRRAALLTAMDRDLQGKFFKFAFLKRIYSGGHLMVF
jgi:hypothetical protein